MRINDKVVTGPELLQLFKRLAARGKYLESWDVVTNGTYRPGPIQTLQTRQLDLFNETRHSRQTH